MNKDIQLPGLGSYMAQSIERGDKTAALWAVLAMIALILASDQRVWRPLLAWADKFKIELTESATPATSRVYDLLRGDYLFTWLNERVWQPLMDKLFQAAGPRARIPVRLNATGKKLLRGAVGVVIALWMSYKVLTALAAAVAALHGALTIPVFGHIVWLGFLTALRVAAMTVLAKFSRARTLGVPNMGPMC
jgi:NitT/TauT family transport system permease protein